jgi:ubiquinone/menaquinone biosynthesis C-methylase UbiE
MPILCNDKDYLQKDQYRDGANLEDRINLHVLFSTNKYGWMPWVLDQIDLPEDARILEIGSGTGLLWCENQGRVPSGWQVTMSDFSYGMVQGARGNLAEIDMQVDFLNLDAEDIPFPPGTFDAVFANHMLYHVPDIPKALRGIKRVLKPGAALYATTIGDNHLLEIQALARRFAPDLPDWHKLDRPFTLQNGAAQLEPFFTRVIRRDYDDALEVTRAEPLVNHTLSGWIEVTPEQRAAYTRFVEAEMQAQGGSIHIRKESGMFICRT